MFRQLVDLVNYNSHMLKKNKLDCVPTLLIKGKPKWTEDLGFRTKTYAKNSMIQVLVTFSGIVLQRQKETTRTK